MKLNEISAYIYANKVKVTLGVVAVVVVLSLVFGSSPTPVESTL